jgi:UDP-2,3-diacylglucosamine pyrophosphatase LpxH
MSISSSITGAPIGESSQLFSLLSIMTDPEAYNKKLKDLLEATENHNKAVALVGPSSEIMKIRQDIEKDREEAKAELDDVRKKASSMVSDATKKSKEILSNANLKQDAILAAAQAKQAAVEAALVAVQARSLEFDDLNARLTSRENQLNAEAINVDKIREEALAMKKEYEAKAEELQKKIAAFANALG